MATGRCRSCTASTAAPDLEELELDHLEGYRGSSPVRVGNGAATQLQLDIYGELIDSVYLYNKYGQPISYDDWTALVGIVDWLCDNWDRPDEGIWEVRGGRQNFTYSRLMCWVAIERAIRMARQRGLPADLDALAATSATRSRSRSWSGAGMPQRNAFVQHYDTDVLDASVLLMPLTKFIAPRDPRWLSTLDAIGEELVSDSLVYRYNIEASPDGLEGEEGTFSICSFWYVEALARAGHLDEARLAFEKMLTYANHLGLYSEEIGPSGEALGNFPQAFTHLALISAAVNLDPSSASSAQAGRPHRQAQPGGGAAAGAGLDRDRSARRVDPLHHRLQPQVVGDARPRQRLLEVEAAPVVADHGMQQAALGRQRDREPRRPRVVAGIGGELRDRPERDRLQRLVQPLDHPQRFEADLHLRLRLHGRQQLPQRRLQAVLPQHRRPQLERHAAGAVDGACDQLGDLDQNRCGTARRRPARSARRTRSSAITQADSTCTVSSCRSAATRERSSSCASTSRSSSARWRCSSSPSRSAR